MNRKLQETDRLFIAAHYRRDPHAFNARGEAKAYGVSLRTIYNTLSQAGIQMRRGRKPIEAPPQPLISPESRSQPPQQRTYLSNIDMGRSREPLLKPPVGPKPPLSPRPPVVITRKGPPVIRPAQGKAR